MGFISIRAKSRAGQKTPVRRPVRRHPTPPPRKAKAPKPGDANYENYQRWVATARSLGDFRIVAPETFVPRLLERFATDSLKIPVTAAELLPGIGFVADLGMDILDVAEMTMAIEDAYERTIEITGMDEELETLTVGTLIAMVARQVHREG